MNNKQIAQKVVDRIVEMIESGAALPWVKPWSKKVTTVTVKDGIRTVTVYPHAWNRRGVEYKGVNTYLPEGEYITWSQCKAEGGIVRKGARAWPVVYWNFVKKETTNADGETEEKTIPILKFYQVFNVKDCDGIEQKHDGKPYTVTEDITHIEPADASGIEYNAAAEDVIADYVRRAGNGFYIDRVAGSDRAYYSPAMDYVNVPHAVQFDRISEYYSTLFHEIGHSTGHASRLNRFTGMAGAAAFGSEEYSKEELVAEATAASCLNALGMEEANTFRNSAAYIKSWSSHIKRDPLMFVSAMTKAQAAFDLIMGLNNAAPAEA